MRVRNNYKSIKAKLNKALEDLGDEGKDYLKDIADTMSVRTPVDTGAFASSYSVVGAGSRATRSVASAGRPRNQDLGSFQALARETMHSDIDGLDILKSGRVQFKNGAPHAPEVNEKYQIFAVAKDKYRGI